VHTRLTVAFDAHLPLARWGPLLHVLCIERPELRLTWEACPFPAAGRSILEGADVGIFVEPPAERGLDALVLETSGMLVAMGVGHRLARHHGDGPLSMAEVLDEPFAGAPDVHPGWRALWTLDRPRGGPPRVVDGGVRDAAQELAVLVSTPAVATMPAWAASGLHHPGVITLPLTDGPRVASRLVWRARTDNPLVHTLVDLAGAWTHGRESPSDPGGPGAGG
jgi:hypothetical protein